MTFRAWPLTRRSLLLGAASAMAEPALAIPPSALNFLVIGDWGNPFAPTQRIVADSMGRIAAQSQSDFVISTGDNFYLNGVRSTDDPQWRTTFEDVFTAPSLQRPWYVVLGNHDYHGSPRAEVNYTRLSDRWRMPSRYWREEIALPDGAHATFFFLDTTPIDKLTGLRDSVPQADFGARDQVMWLEHELAACGTQWKIVVGHHPILSSGVHGASVGMAIHVRPLLERYGVQAYFNGHDHDLEHLRANGVDYFCSGAGSEARTVRTVPQSYFVRSEPGFVACDLSSTALDVCFHDENAAELYRATVTPNAL